eukprot:CAMPEP_0183369446 /NCGR_PEP_ID=MMETSP0164_2-20130417/99366_1 /TAXON_ID=221442 /ORGANISM="Coccolithus pelagicus ssp braarudi, Strain PLY182g" /LENGTH=127 /DNA_ID=CAMNT_0025545709 /DNA_START=461 /DNA_END=844 /DNA_ORIENTATION=-
MPCARVARSAPLVRHILQNISGCDATYDPLARRAAGRPLVRAAEANQLAVKPPKARPLHLDSKTQHVPLIRRKADHIYLWIGQHDGRPNDWTASEVGARAQLQLHLQRKCEATSSPGTLKIAGTGLL